MRLLNLDLDDLYFLSTPMSITSKNGQITEALSMHLGTKINDNLSNTILFGSNKGWDISSDIKLARGSFSVKTKHSTPTIWDEGVKTGKDFNILFTGMHSKDGLYLIEKVMLHATSNSQLNRIKLIAGGCKPTPEGEILYNLVLLVPVDLHYKIGKYIYSCKDDTEVYNSNGDDVSLTNILANSSIL